MKLAEGELPGSFQRPAFWGWTSYQMGKHRPLLGHHGVNSGGMAPMSPRRGSKDNRMVWLFQDQDPTLNDLSLGSEFTLFSNLLCVVYMTLTPFPHPMSELGA